MSVNIRDIEMTSVPSVKHIAVSSVQFY